MLAILKIIALFSFSLSLALPFNGTHAAPADHTVLDILNDVNLYRKQRGLHPLKLRQDISAEAYRHSLEMSQHKIPFGHDGFSVRVKHIYAHTEQPNGAAENVAYHYKDGHDVVKNWLTSPHHLANIKGNYNYTGIGVVRDARGHLYFTQLFLRA